MFILKVIQSSQPQTNTKSRRVNTDSNDEDDANEGDESENNPPKPHDIPLNLPSFNSEL